MKKTFLILATILLLTSCSKSDDTPAIPEDQLPAITTTGANTAGCLIDGKVLIPKNGSQAIGGSPNYGLKYNYGGNFYPNKNDYWQLEIANKKDSDGMGIILWIKNMSTGNGDYVVDQSNGELYSYGPNNNQIIVGITKNGVNKTYYSGANSGIIKINRSDLGFGMSSYSGTFSCTLYNKDNLEDKIQISEGRFDINSLTLNK
jgi:hypothetical protein